MQCALLLGPAAAKNKIGLDLWRWTNLTTYECDFEINATADIRRTCTETQFMLIWEVRISQFIRSFNIHFWFYSLFNTML